MQGELGEAYDVLEAMPQRSAGAALEFDRALLTGLVRHVQWIQVGGQGRGAGGCPLSGQCLNGHWVLWDWFAMVVPAKGCCSRGELSAPPTFGPSLSLGGSSLGWKLNKAVP